MGGEKPLLMMIGALKWGSPPRGRGKEPERFFGLVSHRITPAWAGKSADNYDSAPTLRDHPRVGGEKTKKIP